MHRRVAERNNPDIYLRNFIPPQFFARYCALNKLSRELREEDPEVKTQLRFTKTDIALLTKTRGSEEPFKIRKLTPDESK